MEKLLQWAVNNSDKEELKEQAEAIKRGDYKPDTSKFNPEIIEAILGKDNATLMKEALQCINNPNDTLENKEIALDNFEMLIEGIDNAKNIQNMGLWPTLINLLSDKEVVVRTGVAWICGTAVQNNPDAQKAFLEHQGLKALIPLLSSENKQERAKAVYAISGVLKHQPQAVEEFKSLKGFDFMTSILKNYLEDDAATVRKIIFLYNTLLLENPLLATVELRSLTNELDKAIVTYTIKIEDEDMVEKALRTLHTLIQQSQTKLSDDIKQHVIDAKNKYGQDNLNLDKSEWNQLN
ncbi:unnamed protein product [Cunninghamella blakesleeana]